MRGETVISSVRPEERDEILDSYSTERNYWTVVSDFYATKSFDPVGCHHGVFLRAHTRTWDGKPNMTRFGCYVDSNRKGAIQFNGDNRNNAKSEVQKVVPFSIDENPFDDPDLWYRVQMHEKEIKSVSDWLLHWKAEVWRLSKKENGQGTLLGDSVWFSETTVKRSYGMDIPALSGSRILIGAAPGIDGTVKVSRVATNY